MIDLDFVLGASLTIAYATCVVFIISKWRFFKNSGISQKTLIAAFLIKLVFGFAVGFVFSEYYTDRSKADTFKYFDDSEILFQSIHESPQDFFCMLTGINSKRPELNQYYDQMNYWYDTYSPFNDNRAMIRLNAACRLVSWGHYHVHVVFICFLALIGIVASMYAFSFYHPKHSTSILLLFVCIPSVVFWGSGLLKDSLTIFALGVTLYSLISISENRKPKNIITFVACLFLLLQVRFQVFVLMIPITFAWLIAHYYRKKSHIVFVSTFIAFVLLVVVAWPHLFNTNLIDVMALKRVGFVNLAINEKSGSLFSTDPLNTTFPLVLVEPIKGLWNALTRPYISLNEGITSLIAAMESVLLCLVLALMLIKCCISKHKEWSIFLTMLTVFSVSYLTIMGMITPISGALVRYKAFALPLLIGPLMIASGVVGWFRQLTLQFFNSKVS